MIKILVQKIPISTNFDISDRWRRKRETKEEMPRGCLLEEEKEKGERRKDGGAGRWWNG